MAGGKTYLTHPLSLNVMRGILHPPGDNPTFQVNFDETQKVDTERTPLPTPTPEAVDAVALTLYKINVDGTNMQMVTD